MTDWQEIDGAHWLKKNGYLFVIQKEVQFGDRYTLRAQRANRTMADVVTAYEAPFPYRRGLAPNVFGDAAESIGSVLGMAGGPIGDLTAHAIQEEKTRAEKGQIALGEPLRVSDDVDQLKVLADFLCPEPTNRPHPAEGSLFGLGPNIDRLLEKALERLFPPAEDWKKEHEKEFGEDEPE